MQVQTSVKTSIPHCNWLAKLTISIKCAKNSARMSMQPECSHSRSTNSNLTQNWGKSMKFTQNKAMKLAIAKKL